MEKQKAKLVRIIQDEVKRFIKDWQKSPYERNTEI